MTKDKLKDLEEVFYFNVCFLRIAPGSFHGNRTGGTAERLMGDRRRCMDKTVAVEDEWQQAVELQLTD